MHKVLNVFEKSLFLFRLSVSNDLRVDAERDLRDIGATKIDVHPLNKVSLLWMLICKSWAMLSKKCEGTYRI